MRHAANVAFASSAHAVAHPMFLVHDLAIELVLDEFLLGEALVTPGLESAESQFDAPRLAAIEPAGAA